MTSAMVAGSGPVTRAAISSSNCASAHWACLVSTASEHLVDRRSTDGCVRPMVQHDGEHLLDIHDTSARSRQAARNVAVGNPASAGFAVRVASVNVLCALPTSDRRRRPAFPLDEAGHPVLEFGLDVDSRRVENSANKASPIPTMSA